MDKLPPKSEQALFREMTIARPGRSQPANLRDQVSNSQNWPTPTANNYEQSDIDALLDRRERVKISTGNGNGFGLTLGNAVAIAAKFPTPMARDFHPRGGTDVQEDNGVWTATKKNGIRYGASLPEVIAKYPTPIAGDEKDRGNLSNPCIQRRIEIGKQVSLSMSVSYQSGQLNPDWVEWLMGWPIGWTDLAPRTLKLIDWKTDPANLPVDHPDYTPRVATNIPNRAARIKCIGNGQVPMCAATAFLVLVERLFA